jgi:hypothetical protein
MNLHAAVSALLLFAVFALTPQVADGQDLVRGLASQYQYKYQLGTSNVALIFWTPRGSAGARVVDYAMAVNQNTGWLALGYNSNGPRFVNRIWTEPIFRSRHPNLVSISR